jgi:flagellar basal body P-ring protein FlgI
MKRQSLYLLGLLGSLAILYGCSWFDGGTMRSQSPEEEQNGPKTRLVGDIVAPFGLYPVRVEAIALVTNLPGTGSDPPPSPNRQKLVEEMQVRGVENPNALLASKKCSLVHVQGWMRPGIQKGDRFDVEVRVPTESETTSLRGGYLLETRLSELGVILDAQGRMADGQVHVGRTYGLAQGPLLVEPCADAEKDRVLACRARILGGGIATKSRPLALVLSPGNQSVLNSSRVENAVNRRFHTYQNGLQIGMAKALNNELIELKIHPRYKDNIARYVEVIRSLVLTESSTQRMKRMKDLEKLLLDPDTSPRASLQLEAIGSDGIPALLEALENKDPEVRLYAAEALAYLDRTEAARPLGELAVQEPAFRVFALTALSAMQDPLATEQLRGMLSSSSAETRYGAFRALTAMSDSDSLAADESISDDFSYHVLDLAGPPMIHITHSRRAEIVLFGKDQEFLTPVAINAGNRIMVTSVSPTEISISRFAVGEADQKRQVTTKIDEVIRAIVELGGTYPDIVQALQEAKAAGGLSGRLEVDSLPEPGRTYQRVAESTKATGGDGESVKPKLADPTPDLFDKKDGNSHQDVGEASSQKDSQGSKSQKSASKNTKKSGFFGKITRRGSDKDEG